MNDPRDYPATEVTPTVEMPVKPALRSREAWLFGISGVMAAVLAAIAELPPEMLKGVPWAAFVVRLLLGLSAVAGLIARLSRPDIVSGIPWLDRSTGVVPTRRGHVNEPRI